MVYIFKNHQFKIVKLKTKQPKILLNHPHHNAEVPTWHPQLQCLYWTDIPQGKMYRYHPQGKPEQIYAGEPVGGFTIQKDGSLLLFKTKGTIEHWQEGQIKTIMAEIPAERLTRFNDAIADPLGRVYSGTVATSECSGRLYRLDLDGSLQIIMEGLTVPNGMGFSPDLKYFYTTDSDTHTIYRFEYYLATGELSDPQVHILTTEIDGVPDGLTIDSEGYIWSARWDGGHIFRYSPEGEEVLRIPFPTAQVSSLTFGGADYSRLYITTAGGQNRSTEDNLAGSIFCLNPGVTGKAEFLSQIDVG